MELKAYTLGEISLLIVSDNGWIEGIARGRQRVTTEIVFIMKVSVPGR